MKTILLLLILASACLPQTLSAQQMPKLPSLKKKFPNDVILFRDEHKEHCDIYLGTDQSLADFKKKLKKAIGDSWVEIPHEKIVTDEKPPVSDDPFAGSDLKPPKVMGTVVFATGKKIQWHLQIIMTEAPVKGKKHTVNLSVFRMRLNTPGR